jgi:drug/metabolite transporter (DMT)-like permease
MSDEQALITIVGGFLFALAGGVLLSIPIGFLQRDGVDDSFALIWIFLSALSDAIGLVLSAKWARKHHPEESR